MFEDVDKNPTGDADQSGNNSQDQGGVNKLVSPNSLPTENTSQSPPPVSPPAIKDSENKPVKENPPSIEVEDMLEPADSGSPGSLPPDSPPVVNTSNAFSLGQTPRSTEIPPSINQDKPEMPPISPGTPPPIPPEDLAFTNENLAGKKKMLLVGIVIVVLLLLVVGGYLAYQRFFADSGVNISEPENIETDLNSVDTDNQIPVADDLPDTNDQEVGELPADTDGDGLTDEEELNYNTDPNLADSDQDGLFDREEIITWKTDPLNPDSDGDSYIDGEEVKKGYDPLGPGKLDYYPFVE